MKNWLLSLRCPTQEAKSLLLILSNPQIFLGAASAAPTTLGKRKQTESASAA